LTAAADDTVFFARHFEEEAAASLDAGGT